MLKENKKKFDILNITHYHSLGFYGQGVKIAIFENHDEQHKANVIDVVKQIAPQAEIITFDKKEYNLFSSVNGKSKGFVRAIDKCIELKVDIITSSGVYSTNVDRINAVNKAIENGIVFNQSAGNESAVITQNNIRGVIPEMNVIGAICEDDTKAGYSNTGEQVDGVSYTNIMTTNGTLFTGTSSSTPVYSAMMALLLCRLRSIGLDKDSLEKYIIYKDLGKEGKDNLYGKGLFILPKDITTEGGTEMPISDIKELEPSTRYLVTLLVNKCNEQGIKIKITETYRSQERQDELYAQGRTKQGQIVTWTKDSEHTKRKAFDIVPIINGKADYNNIELFNKIGNIGKSIGLTWGGDWKTPDRPHFQYDGSNVDTRTELEKDVDVLVSKRIISSPDIWKSETYTKENVKALIHKFATYANK